MTNVAHLDEMQLVALISSSLCHDVIGPVGAIANGFEVLDDESDASMRQMALDSIRLYATKASARVQFLRLSFGAMGGAGDQFPLEEARRLTESLYEGEKAKIVWRIEPDNLPKDQVKLLVNLVVVAVSTVPRGGDVTVAMAKDGDTVTFRIVATGDHAVLADITQTLLSDGQPAEQLDGRTIQIYYAYRLAQSLGMAISASTVDGGVEITAGPTA